MLKLFSKNTYFPPIPFKNFNPSLWNTQNSYYMCSYLVQKKSVRKNVEIWQLFSNSLFGFFLLAASFPCRSNTTHEQFSGDTNKKAISVFQWNIVLLAHYSSQYWVCNKLHVCAHIFFTYIYVIIIIVMHYLCFPYSNDDNHNNSLGLHTMNDVTENYE